MLAFVYIRSVDQQSYSSWRGFARGKLRSGEVEGRAPFCYGIFIRVSAAPWEGGFCLCWNFVGRSNAAPRGSVVYLIDYGSRIVLLLALAIRIFAPRQAVKKLAPQWRGRDGRLLGSSAAVLRPVGRLVTSISNCAGTGRLSIQSSRYRFSAGIGSAAGDEAALPGGTSPCGGRCLERTCRG